MKIVIGGEEKPGIPMAELAWGDTFRFVNATKERSTPSYINNADIYLLAEKDSPKPSSALVNLTQGTLPTSTVDRAFLYAHRVERVECELHVKADWR